MLYRGLLFVTGFVMGTAAFTQSVTAVVVGAVLTILTYAATQYET